MDRQAFFEELAGEERPLPFKPEHEVRIARLRQRLGNLEGLRIIEPGCGAGPLTAHLAAWAGGTGVVLALDACAGMVHHCDAQTAHLGHVRVIQAKVEEAEIDPGVWDLVLCFRVYPHLEDGPGFLDRCREWLAPGGALVVANLEGSRELNALHARRPGVHRDRMPSGKALAATLTEKGWRVEEPIDVPGEFFLRAWPD